MHKTKNMSYEIIYHKQFIKIEQEDKPTMFVPLVFGGSNNCYETYFDRKGRPRERRSRSWNVINLGLKNHMGTKEAMLQYQEKYRSGLMQQSPDEYEDSRFGYFAALAIGGTTRTTTYSNYKGVVINGCKNALTVEQLRQSRVKVEIYTASKAFYEQAFENAGIEPCSMYPKTTKEFLDMYEELISKTKPYKIPCYIRFNVDDKGLKEFLGKSIVTTQMKERVDLEKWWSITLDNGCYYIKSGKRNVCYSYNLISAKAFESKKAAEKVAEKLLNKGFKEVVVNEQNEPFFIYKRKKVQSVCV